LQPVCGGGAETRIFMRIRRETAQTRVDVKAARGNGGYGNKPSQIKNLTA